MTTRICMMGANCETEPLRFPHTSVFILHLGIHYLMVLFLIWTYILNALQFLEL